MKKLVFAMVAALAVTPLVTQAAEETAAGAAAEAAKPKKKLNLKPQGYMQFAQAKAEAAKYEVPIFVTVLIDGDEKSALLKKYLLGNKVFKDFASKNFTQMIIKGKFAKDKHSVDLASFKRDREFVEANVMDNNAKEDKPDKLDFYPTCFIVSSTGENKLAHMPKYNPELGLGAWAMDVVAKFEQAGITATVPPALKKLIDDPQPDIKRPAAKGKKK